MSKKIFFYLNMEVLKIKKFVNTHFIINDQKMVRDYTYNLFLLHKIYSGINSMFSLILNKLLKVESTKKRFHNI